MAVTERQTLLLDQTSWDLVLDILGNIAVASPPYALAQDAASECRLFQGEDYYNTAHGIPYWSQILGQFPPISVVKTAYVQAALLVPGVTAAQCFLLSNTGRTLTGQIQILDQTSSVVAASFF